MSREPKESGITRISITDAGYPECVKSLMGRRAPNHLNMVGNLDILDMPGIGFGGSRKCSPKGMTMVGECVEQVVDRGMSVVSGNANGVDIKAHYTCLESGGKTILVLAEGIDHFRVKDALLPVWDWDRVLIISQFEMDDQWRVFRAMTRNKLIVALTRAMVLTEAGETGGTLNAGIDTLKAGVPLFISHYSGMPSYARGNEMLVKMGARNLTDLEEVFTMVKENKLPRRNLQPSLI